MSSAEDIEPNAEIPSVWELRRGNIVLARLEEYDLDFPWVHCRFIASEELEPFRHLFVRNNGRWRGRTEELHQEIAKEGIYLITTDGHRAQAFTISLVGEKALLTFTPV